MTMSDNVDTVEIAKFSALANEWWDPQGKFASLHQINPLRLQWIQEVTSLAEKEIVDVGCGGGLLTEVMAHASAKHVLGIDLANASLEEAKHHANIHDVNNVSYQYVSVENLACEKSGAFDVVTCMEMLEHVPDPQSVVKACAALVKTDGWVFFSTVSRNAQAFLQAIFGAEYVLNIVPRGTHSYAKFICPHELATWARACGLVPHHMMGLTYSPLTKTYSLTKNTRINYMIAMKKYV